MSRNRTKAQRIILVTYCLLIALGCLWVPWRGPKELAYKRLGYALLWKGPQLPKTPPDELPPDFFDKTNAEKPAIVVQAPDGKVIAFPPSFTEADVNREMRKLYGGTPETMSVGKSRPNPFARLDISLILLQLVATTALSGAALLIEGLWTRKND